MATLAPLVITGGRYQQVQSADVLNVPNAGTTSLPSLIIAGDTNTGIWHPAADTLAISTNAVERIRVSTTEVVVNNPGVSTNFRVAGNTFTNLLLVSGVDDAVAIGTSNILSGNMLTVSSSSASTDIDAAPAFLAVRNTNTTNNTFSALSFQSVDTGSTVFGVARIMAKVTSHTPATISGDLIFQCRQSVGSAWSEAMVLTSTSRMGFGTLVPNAKIDVRGTAGLPVAIFNENGVDADLRVEGVGRPDLFIVDAGTARVGINRAAGTHGATLDIDNLAVAESIFIARDNGTAVFTIADGGAVVSTSTNFTIGGAGTMTWPSANASGVLTNNGSGVLTWAAGGGGETAWTLTTTSVDKTVVDHERCFVLASGKTITLPATPSAGNVVTVGVLNFTDTIVARNGSNIMGAAEDFTIDTADTAVTFVYVDATRGWRLI